MQFDLSDEQKLLAESVRSLLADANGKHLPVERFDAGLYTDPNIWPKLNELGLTPLLADAARGGMGDELLTLAVVAEELGYAGVGTPAVQQALAAWLLAQSDVEQSLLDRVFDGSMLVSFALCENLDDWRPAQWQLALGTTLSGEKSWAIGAADAQLLLVGLAGGQFALVDRDVPGVIVEPLDSLDRTRPLYRVRFDKVAARALQTPTDVAGRLFDALTIVTAADAYGASRQCVATTVEYVKTRHQFGRPIGSFQGLKHQIANMAIDVEPCRAMVWYAAHAWDRQAGDTERQAALAKAHIGEIAVRSGRTATEAHGGMGFTWEYPLHILLKRAIFDNAYLGGANILRQRAAQLAGWTT
jgi:alkylation response protein AidB-like acyl-CoA dehydrogenase